MADVLRLLRQVWTENKDAIKDADDVISIGDQDFPKDTRTNYIQWGTEIDTEKKEYYRLDSIVYLLKHSGLPHTLYVRSAMSDNVAVIRRPDRKDLLSYLNGETESSLRIDKTLFIDPSKVRIQKSESKNDTKTKTDSTTDAQNENSQNQSELAALNAELSLDKIANLKAKFLKHQQKTGESERIDMKDSNWVTISEKHCRNRDNISSKHIRNFQNSLASILTLMKKKEMNQESIMSNPKNKVTSYSRYDQERFTSNEFSEYGIGSVSKRPTSTSLTNNGAQMMHSGNHAQPQKIPKKSSSIPIIIVPPFTVNAFVNCTNISTFLETYRYPAKSSDSSFIATTTREKKFVHRRSDKSKKEILYQVTDQPLVDLSKDDWSRVVCVFVHGPAWQFKNWPFQNGVVEIFDKIKAFYVKWKNAPLDKNVSKWNVQIIELSETSRHNDRAEVQRFWESIDQFVAKHNIDVNM